MKRAVRNQVKLALAAMNSTDAQDAGKTACRRLTQLPEFVQSRSIMAYLPIVGEIDITPVILGAWQAGKTVLVPKVSWDKKHMVAVELHSLEAGLVKTRGQLREPEDGALWPEEDIEFVIVPALAFDLQGHRLGRGGGFYDRFFAQPHVHAVRCGLAYHLQVLPDLPRHSHDQPVDILVTDQGVVRFSRAPQDQSPEETDDQPVASRPS